MSFLLDHYRAGSGGMGSGDGPAVWSVDVDAPGPGSTLTNFPLVVHLEIMPDEFWDNVTATGSDIRASIGGLQVPCHLGYIDTASQKGWLWVLIPSYLSTGETITLYGDGEAGFPAADSTYGSEATWVAHEAVYLLNGSLADATGNGHDLTVQAGSSPVFDQVEWGLGGGFVAPNSTALIATGFGTPAAGARTIGSMGNSHIMNPTGNAGLFAYLLTYGSDSDRITLVNRSASNAIDLWDSTNSFAASSGFPYTFEAHRRHVVLDPGVARRLYRDGVQVAQQLTPSLAQWDGNKFVLGASGSSANDYWIGEVGWTYVHNGVLSTDWMLAETAMMEPGYLTLVAPDAVVAYTEIHEAPGAVSTLTNFPYLIDLSALSPEFWRNVKSDGGDIRLYDGTDTQIPFGVFGFDYDARKGFVLAKQTITTSGATFKLEVGYPGRSALAATDTYGIEAVVSDYQAFYLFNGNLLDLTANSRDQTVKVGAAAYRTLLGLPALDTTGAAFQSSVDDTITPSAIYTMSATVSLDANDGNNQQAMTFCQTYGSSSNRSTIGNRAAGEVFTTFSANDSWLDGPGVTIGQPVRLAATYNGSTARQLFVDGSLAATDATISSQTMDTLTIGGGSSSGANWRGRIAMAYLRLSVLSADWLEYEAGNYMGQTANGVESLWVGGEP